MVQNDLSVGKLGFIGLGRMGHAIVLNLLEKGIDVVVYNRTYGKVEDLIVSYENSKLKTQKAKPQLKTQKFSNLIGTDDIRELVQKLTLPRVVWLMVPEGKPVDEMIEKLLEAGMQKNDILIDGGNSFYKDSIRRYHYLLERGIHFVDVGTSGGIEGARNGACLMIGGERKVYEKLVPLFEAASAKDGYAYFGQSGAGHFVKMVHNGVEYGMLQAIGEGFELLARGPYKLDLHAVAKNWSHGSVVRGWLMELLEKVLPESAVSGKYGKLGRLEEVKGVVGGGKTGMWAAETAREMGVSIPVLDAALAARVSSQTKPTFAGKVVASLRNQFGGHATKTIDK